MRLSVFLGFFLIFITLAIYWQTGSHEFVSLDDDMFVTDNVNVKSGLTEKNIIWLFNPVPGAGWHPVTWISHIFDFQIYGNQPRGHHLTNVFIHAATTILIYFLFIYLTGSNLKSIFVAGLFSLHPLQVESVAWVAERRNVLFALFWFLTLLCYSIYVKNGKIKFYIFSILFFLFGIMSKPMIITLPVVMLLIDFWPLNRYSILKNDGGIERFIFSFTIAKRLLLEKIPFIILSTISILITLNIPTIAELIPGAQDLSFELRAANAITSYVKYIARMFWPTDLAVYYPMPNSIPLWQVIFSLLILISISVAVIWHGVRKPYLVVGWFWFLITLVPVIGIIQFGTHAMADRYMYVSGVGLFLVVAWGVPDITKTISHQKHVVLALALVVLLICTYLTNNQLAYWKDSISLYRHTLRVTNNNILIHNNLGVALGEKGFLDEAMLEFAKSIAIFPDYYRAHNNYGLALAGTGRLEEAILEYRRAIEINPNFSDAHNNLGLALASMGRLDESIAEYAKALAISPDHLSAYNNLGLALVGKGELDRAIDVFRKAIAIDPACFEAHYNLGRTFARQGHIPLAIQEYKKVLEIKPDSAEARKSLEFALEQLR